MLLQLLITSIYTFGYLLKHRKKVTVCNACGIGFQSKFCLRMATVNNDQRLAVMGLKRSKICCDVVVSTKSAHVNQRGCRTIPTDAKH